MNLKLEARGGNAVAVGRLESCPCCERTNVLSYQWTIGEIHVIRNTCK